MQAATTEQSRTTCYDAADLLRAVEYAIADAKRMEGLSADTIYPVGADSWDVCLIEHRLPDSSAVFHLAVTANQ